MNPTWVEVARRPEDPKVGWWQDTPGSSLTQATARALYDAGKGELVTKLDKNELGDLGLMMGDGRANRGPEYVLYYVPRTKPERHRIAYFELDPEEEE